VSSIRGALVGFGLPDYTPEPGADKVHRASADCLASIEQLRFYRRHYLNER
jgi:oligoribonuclease (3'-5' exoribonuclease)